jgi:hypothetical protein
VTVTSWSNQYSRLALIVGVLNVVVVVVVIVVVVVVVVVEIIGVVTECERRMFRVCFKIVE